MKNITFSVIVLSFLILLPANFAHANFFTPYAAFYTTGSQNSTTPQSTFSWNETPWIYIQLYNTPPAEINSQLHLNVYHTPGTAELYSTRFTTHDNQIWVNLSESYWNSIKATGVWHAVVDIENGPVSFPSGTSNFKINAAPEPASIILFLTGAFILSIAILRRKKILAV